MARANPDLVLSYMIQKETCIRLMQSHKAYKEYEGRFDNVGFYCYLGQYIGDLNYSLLISTSGAKMLWVEPFDGNSYDKDVAAFVRQLLVKKSTLAVKKSTNVLPVLVTFEGVPQYLDDLFKAAEIHVVRLGPDFEAFCKKSSYADPEQQPEI